LEWNLVEGAFEMARASRMKILDFMQSVMAAPNADLSQHAPRIHTIAIDPEKIGMLIGPGGKNIRRITAMSGAEIEVDDTGKVLIYATNKEAMELAISEVSMVTAEIEIGKIYNGTVTGIKDFGAFVEVLPGKEGLVHISELADFRVNNVEEVCKIGDPMWVKCISRDERGRVRLSRRQAMAEKDA
jgi:polyribonucleotide nucleotidyltransferase